MRGLPQLHHHTRAKFITLHLCMRKAEIKICLRNILQKKWSCGKIFLTFSEWDSKIAIPSSYKCVVISSIGQVLRVHIDISACKICYLCILISLQIQTRLLRAENKDIHCERGTWSWNGPLLPLFSPQVSAWMERATRDWKRHQHGLKAVLTAQGSQ